MFADENKGLWVHRPIRYDQNWNPEGNVRVWHGFDAMYLYPEYLTDLKVMFCPSDVDAGPGNDFDKYNMRSSNEGGNLRAVGENWNLPAAQPNPVASKTPLPSHDDCNDQPGQCWVMGYDWSYAYWGVIVDPKWVANETDSAGVFTFLHSGYPDGVGCLRNIFKDNKYTLPSTGETVTLFRIKEGIERFMITDINNPAAGSKAASEIAVMFDTIRTTTGGAVSEGGKDFCHLPGGTNVLFMDGHVEFGRYPQPEGSKFWMVTRAILNDSQQYSP